MIQEVFRLFFGDTAIMTILIGAMLFVGVLIIATDFMKGRW